MYGIRKYLILPPSLFKHFIIYVENYVSLVRV